MFKNIEFQRVHRLGNQPRSDGSSRMIIARFLRYSDREKVIRCGYKLKGTDFKIYEDIPKELHDLRKPQMKKLKDARKEGKRILVGPSQINFLLTESMLNHKINICEQSKILVYKFKLTFATFEY